MHKILILILLFTPLLGKAQEGNVYPHSRFEIDSAGFKGKMKADTTRYSDGRTAAIGHFAIDRNGITSGNKVGLWIQYYHNGQIRSKGSYQINSVLVSVGKTAKRAESSYKVGLWEYFYENGQIQAKGTYEIQAQPAQTGIANQFKKIAIVTDNWTFLNEDGSDVMDRQKVIALIEYNPNGM